MQRTLEAGQKLLDYGFNMIAGRLQRKQEDIRGMAAIEIDASSEQHYESSSYQSK